MGKVAKEFCRWRRLDQLRICICGPSGSGADELARHLGRRYNVPAFDFEQLVEEQRQRPTALGQELARAMDEIEKGAVNPKAPGPAFLPPPLAAQCVEESLKVKPAAFRGYVLSGYPQHVDDVPIFFCEDGPLQPPLLSPPQEAGEEDAEPPAEQAEPVRLLRPAAVQDAMVVLTCSEANCLARLKASNSAMPEALVKRRFERWSKENPPEPVPREGFVGCLGERLGAEAVAINADETELEDMAAQVEQHVRAKRHVINFLEVDEPQPEQADEPVDEGVASRAKTPAAAEEQVGVDSAAEEALKQLQKEETVRLEKHSEPLRQYIAGMVMPTLTNGLIDMCREQPEDPVGYLAEYLAVYSRVAKAHGKKPGMKPP